MQGLGLRVVRDLPWPESSASFPAFQTEAHNIECYFIRSTESLRCDIRTGLKPPPRKAAGCTRRMTGYEMKVVGHPQAVCAPEAVLLPILRVLKARTSWLFHGFRCYAGHSSIRCRNQVFEGFFLSKRRSHST